MEQVAVVIGAFLESCVKLGADLPPWGWLATFWAFFLLDLPRDVVNAVFILSHRRRGPDPLPHAGVPQPPLTVVLPALNEERTIVHTVRSLHEQDYPALEIIVVDDGSTDRTPELCRAMEQQGLIRYVRFEERQGKSPAVNWGAALASSDIIIFMDTDTTLDRGALAKVAARFSDPGVAAVAGDVGVRNARTNLVTRLQELEYLWAITVGRIGASGLGILGIVSGAFGGFRKRLLDRVGGHDPGPDNDSDLTIRLRKLGRIAFVPEATCLTNVPVRWRSWIKQRLRWSRSVVRTFLRKHRTSYDLRSKKFSWRDVATLLDCVLFEGVFSVLWVGYLIYLAIFWRSDFAQILAINYGLYFVTDAGRLFLAGAVSGRGRNPALALAVPFMPVYRIALKFVQAFAALQELLFRASYRDPFAPAKVRPQVSVD